jgi:hypothetical protein
MITITYRVILLLVVILIIKNMHEEEKFINQATGAMVIIPLVLRLLMIK